MRKSKLVVGSLSRRTPLEPDNIRIKGNDFARAVSQFAQEYLRGAIEVETVGDNDGIMSMSPTLASYAIKNMLLYTAEDEVLRVKIVLDEMVKIEATFKRMPRTEHLAKIINFARACGFEVKRSELTIVLLTEIRNTDILKIYAVSFDTFARDLYNIFFL